MLCFSRQPGQNVVIRTTAGEEIVVTVLEFRKNYIRIGFEAAREIEIDRGEIRAAKDADTRTVEGAK